ncbi:MAG: hypothetical protein ABIK12_05540 [Pseudomonadota bacterium]
MSTPPHNTRRQAVFKLAHDPLAPFADSRSPAGLYARSRWLGGAPRLGRDMARAVAALRRGQRADGSWGGSPLITLGRLFGLHLTQRDPDPAVERGLDRLWELAMAPAAPATPTARELHGLPLAPSRGDALWPAAALFLATIFGREQEPKVIEELRHLEKRMMNSDALGWAARSNLLRALAVHPEFCRGPGVRAFLEQLLEVASEQGAWPRGLPFHQVFNALAHIPGRRAPGLLRPLLPGLVLAQARDGWWGRTDREFKSFLLVHALKNLGLLPR